MRLSIGILAIILTLGGCATPPDHIAPVSLSEETYSKGSCRHLDSELVRTRFNLDTVSERQENILVTDMAVMFLILVPPSVLIGDYAAEIAHLKGQIEAIEHQMDVKGC